MLGSIRPYILSSTISNDDDLDIEEVCFYDRQTALLSNHLYLFDVEDVEAIEADEIRVQPDCAVIVTGASQLKSKIKPFCRHFAATSLSLRKCGNMILKAVASNISEGDRLEGSEKVTFRSIVSQIISGDLTSDQLIHEHLELLDNPPDDCLVPAIVDFSHSENKELPLESILEKILDTFPKANGFVWKKGIVLLLSSSSTFTFSAHKDEMELLLAPHGGIMVISDGLYSPSRLKELYAILLSIPKFVYAIPSIGNEYEHVFEANDFKVNLFVGLGVAHLMEQSKVKHFLGLADRDVYILACSDEENDTDYLNVMYAYLLTNHSLSRSAELLKMHKNTVAYKLNKIKAIIGHDLPRNKEQFNYLLSYYLIQHARAFLGKAYGDEEAALFWISSFD